MTFRLPRRAGLLRVWAMSGRVWCCVGIRTFRAWLAWRAAFRLLIRAVWGCRLTTIRRSFRITWRPGVPMPGMRFLTAIGVGGRFSWLRLSTTGMPPPRPREKHSGPTGLVRSKPATPIVIAGHCLEQASSSGVGPVISEVPPDTAMKDDVSTGMSYTSSSPPLCTTVMVSPD